MQKALFITMLLLMFVWGGVAFGADTCPDVTGIWEGTGELVFTTHINPPTFTSTFLVISLDTQNGCSFSGVLPDMFNIPVVGTLRKVSPTQYVVTMQHSVILAWGSRVIEGTLNCSINSGVRNAFPSPTQPVCNTMSTSYHTYHFDPNVGAYGVHVGTMTFLKQ